MFQIGRFPRDSLAQPSPPSPLSLSGRGGVGRILVRNLPSPREHIFTHISARGMRLKPRHGSLRLVARLRRRRPTPSRRLPSGDFSRPPGGVDTPHCTAVKKMWVTICPERERGLGVRAARQQLSSSNESYLTGCARRAVCRPPPPRGAAARGAGRGAHRWRCGG